MALEIFDFRLTIVCLFNCQFAIVNLQFSIDSEYPISRPIAIPPQTFFPNRLNKLLKGEKIEKGNGFFSLIGVEKKDK